MKLFRIGCSSWLLLAFSCLLSGCAAIESPPRCEPVHIVVPVDKPQE